MDHREHYYSDGDADEAHSSSLKEEHVEAMALIMGPRRDESAESGTVKTNVSTRTYKYPFCFLLGALLTLSMVVILSSTQQRTAGQAVMAGLLQHRNEVFQYPDRIPEIAWMMSFGGSGTSYTILNTEQMSGFSTASNYGGDFEPCLPVHPNSPNGPYIRSPRKGLPSSHILTKTHCGGFCMDCPPAAYMFSDAQQFQETCFAGRRRWPNGTTEHVSYYYDNNSTSTVRPTRAVHLVRHPFDNLVGRMHLGIQHHRQRDNQQELVWSNNNKDNSTQATLLQWCEYLDDKYRDREPHYFSEEYMTKYGDIPCHAEFYRYIQWHNMATAVTTELLQIPVHYLWYDNYTTHFEETVAQLLDFLHLSYDDRTPYEWMGAGKTYANDLPPALQSSAARMMRDLATPAVWKLIQHYLDPFLSE